MTWESESSIKLLYVQSHTQPHLQSFVHGSPTFLEEQRPEHPLSALHPHFVSSLHASDTLGCVIQQGTKSFLCLFYPHSSGLGRFCIGINDRDQTNAAWYTAMRTCCFHESCVGGKFSICQPHWAKCFRLYLVDSAWYIKQKNLSIWY